MRVRNLLALMMLVMLALGGAAPACAHQPPPAHHGMAHESSAPCDQDAAAHANCIGCGVELPSPPHVGGVVLAAVPMPAIVRRESRPIGATPALPLRPPRLLV